MAARQGMKKKGYQPISTFWALMVPGAMAGIIYYAMNTHGYVATRIRSAILPIIEPISNFFSGLF